MQREPVNGRTLFQVHRSALLYHRQRLLGGVEQVVAFLRVVHALRNIVRSQARHAVCDPQYGIRRIVRKRACRIVHRRIEFFHFLGVFNRGTVNAPAVEPTHREESLRYQIVPVGIFAEPREHQAELARNRIRNAAAFRKAVRKNTVLHGGFIRREHFLLRFRDLHRLALDLQVQERHARSHVTAAQHPERSLFGAWRHGKSRIAEQRLGRGQGRPRKAGQEQSYPKKSHGYLMSISSTPLMVLYLKSSSLNFFTTFRLTMLYHEALPDGSTV